MFPVRAKYIVDPNRLCHSVIRQNVVQWGSVRSKDVSRKEDRPENACSARRAKS